MDKKVKIAVISIFIVFTIGLVIDANNKMKAIKARDNKAAMQGEVQPTPENPYTQQQQQPQQPNPYTQANEGPIPPEQMQSEIQEPQTSYEESGIQNPVDNNIPDTKIKNNKIEINTLNISLQVNTISKDYKVTDKQKNTYYFIDKTSSDRLSEGTLGLLLKTDPTDKSIWCLELKAVSDIPYTVKSLSVDSSGLKVKITSQYGATKDILIATTGKVMLNPFKVVFSSDFMPKYFAVDVVKNFTFKNCPFKIIAFTNTQKPDDKGSYTQDFYAYKIEAAKMVRTKYLFSKPINPQTPLDNIVPDFTVTDQGTDALIIAMGKPIEGARGYSNAVTVKMDELLNKIPGAKATAPLEIHHGMVLVSGNYETVIK